MTFQTTETQKGYLLCILSQEPTGGYPDRKPTRQKKGGGGGRGERNPGNRNPIWKKGEETLKENCEGQL